MQADTYCLCRMNLGSKSSDSLGSGSYGDWDSSPSPFPIDSEVQTSSYSPFKTESGKSIRSSSRSPIGMEAGFQNLGSQHSCYHCPYTTSRQPELSRHLHRGHPELLRCQECSVEFANRGDLNHHAIESKHQPFKCTNCGAGSNRIDSYQCHLRIHTINRPCFPCLFCFKYRDSEAFSREDKLSDHLRQYHKHEKALRKVKKSDKRRRDEL
jgi:hypothetical protein